MSKRITCNGLSLADVKRARQQVIDFKRDIQTKFNLLMQALADKGVELAKQNLTAYHMPYATGGLESSIQGVYDPDTGRGAIFSDSATAIYFEFGTGVKGQGAPHPAADESGYAYDINAHGLEGWWYYSDGFHWTQGMPSRPFMWNTANDLRNMLDDMARQIFQS